MVAFDKTKQPRMKHFQKTKSPVLVKNLLITENESNHWLLKGNSSLILAIFCIDINNGWITFTRIICMDD